MQIERNFFNSIDSIALAHSIDEKINKTRILAQGLIGVNEVKQLRIKSEQYCPFINSLRIVVEYMT